MKLGRMTRAATLAASLAACATAQANDDARLVGEMDVAYQAAVEKGDWQAMERILHPGFVLVLGDGRVYTREEVVGSSKKGVITYRRQAIVPGTQAVRLYGRDTATVTAQLHLTGKRNDNAASFDFKLWYTDTYVRTAEGWRYAFGQAGTPLPEKPAAS